MRNLRIFFCCIFEFFRYTEYAVYLISGHLTLYIVTFNIIIRAKRHWDSTLIQSSYSAIYYGRNWLDTIITTQLQPLMWAASCRDPTLIYLINKHDLILFSQLWFLVSVSSDCCLQHGSPVLYLPSTISEQQDAVDFVLKPIRWAELSEQGVSLTNSRCVAQKGIYRRFHGSLVIIFIYL